MNNLQIFLSAYMENTQYGKKRRKTVHILVNNGSTMKTFLDPFFLYQLDWIKPKNHFTLLSLYTPTDTKYKVLLQA